MGTSPANEQTVDPQHAAARGHGEVSASDEALLEFPDAASNKSESGEVNALESLQRRLEAVEREVLMSRAELENSRKRLQRDADQQLKYANLPLVRDILDVIDNLNRATEAAKNDMGNTQVLLDGVKLVAQQLTGVLTKFACKPIESLGQPFDPNFHEAIAQTPSSSYAAGCVAQEVAVGYTLHDRVIRPSQVIVSTGSATPPSK